MDLRDAVRPFLTKVEKPGRYIGKEWNRIRKDPAEVRFTMALCYPDVYEIGMSHLGLSLLYHQVNETEGWAAERCFAPWPDMARRMTERGIPLYTLESGTPLDRFDLIGFSLQHELLYTNVLYMLDLAGIPFQSAQRPDEAPLVIAGGTGAFTPAPLAGVFDLFLVGDGEAALPPLLALVEKLRGEKATRREILAKAAQDLPFAYVPGHASSPVRAAYVEDLENVPIPGRPVLPGIRCIHERITLEIMRGCTRGCRFCQAGMTKRPLRTRSPETLLEAAKEIYAHTGYDEISICSLSSADYPELGRLIDLFNTAFQPLRVGLSLPSLRVGENLKTAPAMTAAVRKAGLTLAPEVATDRLRRQMNKAITNADLEEGVLKAFEAGWRRVKLYFMIGLPGETEEDVRAIARMALRISDLRRILGKGPAKVTVSVSTFVPKAHTPFQWCPMAVPEEINDKHRILLKAGLPGRIRFNFHDRGMSFVEALLARGGRELGPTVERAYRLGASFDAWKDRFSLKTWEQAIEETGIDTTAALHRVRGRDEPFPWDGIDAGPTREFLWSEYEKALCGEITPYCETGPCNRCGLDQALCRKLKRNRGGPEVTP